MSDSPLYQVLRGQSCSKYDSAAGSVIPAISPNNPKATKTMPHSLAPKEH
jgi:hypothetical protein